MRSLRLTSHRDTNINPDTNINITTHLMESDGMFSPERDFKTKCDVFSNQKDALEGG